MSQNNINGLAHDTMIGALLVTPKKITATVEDGGQAGSRKGLPFGWLKGPVSCSGEMTLTLGDMLILNEAARLAGSWQNIDTFDIRVVASTSSIASFVELPDCKITLSNVLDVDTESADETTYTVPFVVTGSDVVRFNGVPYADPEAASLIASVKSLFS